MQHKIRDGRRFLCPQTRTFTMGYLRGSSLTPKCSSLTPKCSHIYSKGYTRWITCAHLKSSLMWSNILTLSSSPTPVIPSINMLILIILRNLQPLQTTKWNTGDVLKNQRIIPMKRNCSHSELLKGSCNLQRTISWNPEWELPHAGLRQHHLSLWAVWWTKWFHLYGVSHMTCGWHIAANLIRNFEAHFLHENAKFTLPQSQTNLAQTAPESGKQVRP